VRGDRIEGISNMAQTDKLNQVLRRTGAWRRTIEVARALGAGVTIVLAVTLAAVMLDAALGLPAAGLVVLNIALLGTAIAMVGYLVWQWAANRFDARRIAMLIERRVSACGSRLINALELAAPAEGAHANTSAVLREMAIEEGIEAASSVQPQRVVDRQPMNRAMMTAAGAIAAVAVLYLLAPRVFGMVVPRLLNPTADLPPYTLVEFDITTEPQQIYHGKRARITATLGGPIVPTQASVVFTDREPRQRVPMQRVEEGVFVLPIERATESRTFYVDTPDGRSAAQVLSVLPVPLFERVTLRFDYPTYTGWPSVERRLDDTGLRALTGTQVTVIVESNLPLSEGRLVLTPGEQDSTQSHLVLEPMEMQVNVAAGSFTLTQTGEYRLTLFSEDGVESESPLTGAIEALADRTPTVQLLEPDLRVVAPEGFDVPIVMAASDDIGVERLDLHTRVNDDAAATEPMALDRQRPAYATGRTTIDLAALGAKAGDTVRAFATAYDNHPPASHSADSPSIEIKVVTEQAYRDLAREQYGIEQVLGEVERIRAEMDAIGKARDELIKRLEDLRDRMGERGTDGAELTDQEKAAMEAIEDALSDYADRLDELAKALNERAERDAIYEFEPAYQKSLHELAAALAQQAGAARHSLDDLSKRPGRKTVDEIIAQLKRDRGEAEQQDADNVLTELQLMQLAAVDRLLEQTDRIMDVAKLQKDLVEKLVTFRESMGELSADTRARLDRLAAEQAELRDELTDAADRLEDVGEDVADLLPIASNSAIELAQKIRDKLKVPDDQSAAATAALAGDGPTAYRAADEASRKLQSLIADCDGLCEAASNEIDGVLALTRQQLQRALSQMAQGRRARGNGFAGGGDTRGSGTGATGAHAGGPPNRATLMGPHTAGLSGPSATASSRKTGSYSPMREGAAEGHAPGVEQLDPTARETASAGAGLPGTPLPYRHLAEQYFRRIAEDSQPR